MSSVTTWGLNHATGWTRPSGSTNPIDPAGTVNEYGSLYDPLAYAGYPCHYSAHYKNLLGWLPAANVAVIDSTTVSNVRIYAHDGGSLNPARKYAIRIPTSVSDATTPGGRDYWLETRTIFNPSVPANKRDGLIVKWGDQIGSPEGSCDLDLTPNSLPDNNTLDDFADAILTVGTTFADPWQAPAGSNRITVTPVASGGTGADKWVDVAITTPDANLSALSFSAGALSPAFAPATASYDVTAVGATSTTVTATAAAGATIQVRTNGGGYTSLTSGVASSALTLVGGPNVIDVKVTNGGWTRTYTATMATLQAFPAVAGSLGAIPDDRLPPALEGSPRNVQFTVSGLSGSLTNVAVNFTLNPAHVYGSDVVVKLIAPNGTTTHTVMALDHLNDNTDLAGPYTFADDATVPISTALSAVSGGTAASGRYRTQNDSNTPTSMLPAFSALSGAALNGTWTLRFTDRYGGDSGGVGAAIFFLATTGAPAAPEIAVEQPAGTNLNTGATVTYGNQTVGVASTAKTFTIKNTGSAALTVSSVSVTGGNAADFTVNTTGMATSVPATTGSTSFTVTFNPSAVGARNTTLRIVNNDSDEGTFDLLLTGSGVSNNADLSALTTTAGALSPAFAAATTSYSASVPNATTSVTVTPAKADTGATLQVRANGGAYASVASGAASGNLALNVGANTINILVTAEDTTTIKTYTLNVTRGAPALTGSPITPAAVITTSQWSVAGDGSKENMINNSGLSGAGADPTKLHDASGSAATMWHAGPNAGGISGGATGNPPEVTTQAVEFDLGANYDLSGAHVWNMNQAGVTGRGVRGVQILISTTISGAFTALTTTEFTQGAGAAGLAAQVVPFTGATNVRRVRFAIQSAWSGAASEYVGLSEVRFQGTVSLSTNADLSALTTTAGALTPAFAAATLSYSTPNVPNATASVTVTPTVADANATVKVNTVTVASGSASGPINLAVGANAITIEVTSQSGATKTYTLNVTRNAPAGLVTFAGTNPGAIPDNNPTGRDILFNVTGTPGVVKTVSTQFTFNPAHTYLSDLRIQLISPSGTVAWIYESSETRSNNVAGPYTIADTGAASLHMASNGLANTDTLASITYQAANGATLLSLNLVFGGTDPNGTWRLRFTDLGADDTGSVSQASLTLTTGAPGKAVLTTLANGHTVLSLTEADPSANYDLQRSADLQTWSLLQSKTTNASGATTHTDTAPPATRSFYRFVPRP